MVRHRFLVPAFLGSNPSIPANYEDIMKVKNSLKSLKLRHPKAKIVKRRGRLFVICPVRRYNARQG